MVRFYYRSVMALMVVGLLGAGCQQGSSSTPSSSSAQSSSAPTAPSPPPQRTPPPPPQDDRSLAFFPLNPADFSMQAIQENKTRVEENPEDANAFIQLGHANYMISRWPTAKDYYEKAVHIDGSLVEARVGLSNCLALMGQLDPALRELSAILSVDEGQPIALYNQGLLLMFGKNDQVGAKQAWEALVSRHPTGDLSMLASSRLSRL